MPERAGRAGAGACRAQRSRAWAAALLATTLCTGTIATAASAHHGQPATGEDELGEQGSELGGGAAGALTSTDTEQTPVAKDGAAAGWEQIGGSLWRSDGSITQLTGSSDRPSPTPYDLDFYGLDFLDREIARQALLKAAGKPESAMSAQERQELDEAAGDAAKESGFAVGAQCRRSDPSEPVPAEEVASCERIPVIYRYRNDPQKGLLWEESYRADDATDKGGFVGAVAWLTPNTALAVGGTDTYPRREPGCVTGAADCPDPAGMARAWIFHSDPNSEDPKVRHGFWRELQNKPDPPTGFTGTDGDEIPDQMGGLNAIDASPRPFDCGSAYTQECAIAGGLAQLWHFADGRFIRGYGPDLQSSGPLSGGPAFRFRVRDVRFFPHWRTAPFHRFAPDTPFRVRAAAVTSGCCAAQRADDRSAVLGLDAFGWQASADSWSKQADLSCVPNGLSCTPHPLPVNETLQPAWEARNRAGREAHRFRPDSFYAVGGFVRVTCSTTGCGGPEKDSYGWSAFLRTPGGPSERYAPREPSSRFWSECQGWTESWNPLCPEGTEALSENHSTIRLVSADDDLLGQFDWAVGSLRSSGQGIAYTTLASASLTPSPASCVGEAIPNSGTGLCSGEGYRKQQSSVRLYALSSYALNAYRVAGADPFTGDRGTGWAVGDHGAIATRGGSIAAAEPQPARRGTKSAPQSLGAGDPFAAHRAPTTAEPGTVPQLTPGAKPAEPGFYESQAPGGIQPPRQMVMSRDGSEGFSWHADGNVYRYDGLRWTQCDASCGNPPGGVNGVARVPLERDSDPRNDEAFEAAAINGEGLYRYRDGRWFRDKDATYDIGFGPQPVAGGLGEDVAFTAPDDGWVMGRFGSRSGNAGVFHFDGEDWWECTPMLGETPPKPCGDPQQKLQTLPARDGGQLGLVSAGERVYLYANREDGESGPTSGWNCGTPEGRLLCTNEPYPLILYHDRGGTWQGGVDPDWQGGVDTTPEDGYNPTDGGWDPGCVSGGGSDPFSSCKNKSTGNPKDQGLILSLSVAQNADGSFQGWALGTFGGTDQESADAVGLRLSDGRDVPSASDVGTVMWRQWKVPDALNDYLRAAQSLSPLNEGHQLTLPSEAARRSAFLISGFGLTTQTSGAGIQTGRPPALAFDRLRGRWEAIPTPWGPEEIDGRAIAPDGRGGFWAAVGGVSFHHYTDRAPAEVFAEAPDPVGSARITAFDAGANGTLWLGDENGGVYRYDRLSGWSERVQIPGWDPRGTPNPAQVSAIAVEPGGEGVAVGPGGRIATLGFKVALDPAATVGCDPQAIVPPCGTGNDLLGAAVAPDGSALAVGKNRTVLWRPAGGDFRRVAEPPVPLATELTKVEMPTPSRAYIPGFTGEMAAPGEWRWRRENSPGGDIAVDASGHGYGVAGSTIYERVGDGESPWKPIESVIGLDLNAVAIPEGGGEGVIVGGQGAILTLVRGQFEPARLNVPFDPVGGIVELALIPGYEPGDVEAWALRQSGHLDPRSPRPQSLLHYPAEPDEPRLDPDRGVAALPDVPAATPGEISFAAFGKQDCDGRRSLSGAGTFFSGIASNAHKTCEPHFGGHMTNDLIAQRVLDEVSARSGSEGAPEFSVFTGDAVDMPGGQESVYLRDPFFAHLDRTPLDINLKHRRWVELVANPLTDAGLPVLGVIGGQDLARNSEHCAPPPTELFFGGCAAPAQAGTEQFGGQAGLNLPWRAAMATVPAPWEGDQSAGELSFERIDAGALSQQGPDQATPPLTGLGASAPQGTGARARAESYRLGAGDTHYAADVYREEDAVARVVVVDTSMRSLAASDPLQHPIEAGGQLRWLDEMTCFDGSPEDTDGDVRDCTREPGQQAIVVSNTPTYSYGPISPEELQTDAAVFESILLKNQVNVVVSGRLGWQGRYWTLAPGVHAPCPGEHYRPDSQAPSLDRPEVCGANAGAEADPNEVADQLPDEAEDAAGLASRGAIPTVVSSSAGGRFNFRAERSGFATAEQGFWRGYAIVRLHPSGDPARTIVEQRPILDWVGLSTNDPVLEPRRTLQLQSFAREAFGTDTAPRYYEIPQTQAITHRYHLLLADQDEPWRACLASDSTCQALHAKLSAGVSGLALQQQAAATQDLTPSASATGTSSDNPCEPYLCLPERVGTIDSDAGEVRAGNGKYPDTFAIATLSVGEHVAAQALVFTRSPSFIVNPVLARPSLPNSAADAGFEPRVPPPPNIPKPNIPQPNVPELPALPGIPPLTAAQPPEPQPPAPPAPPPPSEQPSPLDLTVSPQAIAIATPTAVIQPPTPPVNPAPPGGARREARQRQAAAQKSGADSDAETEGESHVADHTRGSAGDLGMSRRDRTRPEPSFTALAGRDQPSAWAQGALYTGGIALVAFALAAGFSRGRPTPRSRPPEVPAPAWARARRR